MICALVVTDGRGDLLSQSIASLEANVFGPVTRRIIHDDSGDDVYRRWLRRTFRDFEIIFHPEGRQGFGGSYRNAWRFLTGVKEPYCFVTEDDFLYRQTVHLDEVIQTLEADPHLVQVALRRQPWNNEEKAAGGIVEQNPGAYRDRCSGSNEYLEHELFFTTNPSLYRRSLCGVGWPEDPHSEGQLGFRLKEIDPDCKFAFWGARHSGVWVSHIGVDRTAAGCGY